MFWTICYRHKQLFMNNTLNNENGVRRKKTSRHVKRHSGLARAVLIRRTALRPHACRGFAYRRCFHQSWVDTRQSGRVKGHTQQLSATRERNYWYIINNSTEMGLSTVMTLFNEQLNRALSSMILASWRAIPLESIFLHRVLWWSTFWIHVKGSGMRAKGKNLGLHGCRYHPIHISKGHLAFHCSEDEGWIWLRTE